MRPKGNRVLLIDDDASLRTVLEFGLREAGYDVVAEGTGTTGLACMEASCFEVVVMDVRLPDMSGLDVLRAVRGRSPATKVILITAYGSTRQALDALDLGVFAYMTKPFSREKFHHIVADAFDVAAAERSARLGEASTPPAPENPREARSL